MPVNNRIAAFGPEMTAWRRQLHQIPELSLETPLTAAFVEARLLEFGVDEVQTGIAENGIVAIIRGNGGSGPTIGLRADMDGLPITEVRDHEYRSRHAGRMHACGHDGHMTMLLGAARYLAETRNFSGRVALIFQPGEEDGGGGRVMCDQGIMERFAIGQVYALHNWPNMETGTFGMVAGPTMAAADMLNITITGKGAHGAYPHLSVDPIAVAAQLVLALQAITARQVNALDQVVISITTFHAGTAHNVIPGQAVLTGTVRTLNEATRAEVIGRIAHLVATLPPAFGATGEFVCDEGYPVTVNDAGAAAFAARVASEVVGAAKVDMARPPEMAAEDFAYMLQRRPGAYVFLGGGAGAGLHHPEYDFNDAIAPIGASYLARLVEAAQPPGN